MQFRKNYIARLPFEMRGDILLNLDRFSLDRAGFTCPQFHAVVSCLVGAGLRVLTSMRLDVAKSDCDEGRYEFDMSLDYVSAPVVPRVRLHERKD